MKLRMRMLALSLSAIMATSALPANCFAAELQADDAIVNEVSVDSGEESVGVDTTSDEAVVTTDVSDENDKTNIADKTNKADASGGATVDDSMSKELSDDTEGLSEALDDLSEELLETGILEGDEFDAAEPIFGVDQGKLTCSDKSRIPDTVDLTQIEGVENLKEIPENFFNYNGNDKIVSVIIPNSVESIGKNAFKGCSNLYSVTFKKVTETDVYMNLNDGAFSGCSSLMYSNGNEQFVIPKEVTYIADNCFQDCSDLCYVYFENANNLHDIGKNAFAGCSSLQKLINFETANYDGFTTLQEGVFKGTKLSGSLKLPDQLKEIEASAFANCKKLGILDISNTKIEKIAGNAFSESGLKGIKLPDTYSIIKANTFAKCESLEKISLGGKTTGVYTINANAFSGCTNLKTVELEKSVTTVENGAFRRCPALTNVKIFNKGENGEAEIVLDYDSFPLNEGLTLYGYAGTVEEWAAKHSADGVKYKSLYSDLQIKLNDIYGGNIVTYEVKGDVGNGATVKLTDKPASGNVLISMTHGATTGEFCASTKSFVISGSDVDSDNNVRAKVAFANITKGDTDFSFISSNKKQISKGKDRRTGEEVFKITLDGNTVPLKIAAENDTYGEVYSNPWLWTFKSSDEKCVKVDADGKLKPVKATSSDVRVTATLKANSKVQIALDVRVLGAKDFGSITAIGYGKLKSDGTFSNPDDYYLPSKITQSDDVVSTTKNWVDLATLSKTTRDFNVTVLAKSADESMISSEYGYTWTSKNTSIAKVAKSSTENGTNTIQLCGAGETKIVVTSKDKKEESKSFTVKVIDVTPYVNESSIVINTEGKGTPYAMFHLIEAYGGKIDTHFTKPVDSSVDADPAFPTVFAKSGNKWVNKSADFDVNWGTLEECSDVIPLTISVKPTSKDYFKETSATNLYIRVLVGEKSADKIVNADYYYVQLPKVTITKKSPAPKVTYTGKVNKFYKGGPVGPDGTYLLETTVKVKLAKVANYNIVDSAFATSGYSSITGTKLTLEALETDKNKAFCDNFDITSVERLSDGSANVTIVLKSQSIKLDDKNKEAVTGYLCVPYEGGVLSKLKITIPTCKTAPKYVLRETTLTKHVAATGNPLVATIVDASDKLKPTVTFTDGDAVEYDKAKMEGIYHNYDPEFTDDSQVTGVYQGIKLNFTQYLEKNSKVVLLVKKATWNESLSFTENIKVSTANPKLVLGQSSITINKAATTMNSTTAKITGDSINHKWDNIEFYNAETNQKRYDEAEKLELSFDKVNGVIAATINDDSIAKGTYWFTVVFSGKYYGGAEHGNPFNGNARIGITITEVKPTVTIKSKTFVLNDWFCGVTDAGGNPVEEIKVPYVVNNVPGADVTLTSGETKLVDTTTKVEYIYNRTSFVDANSQNAPVKVKFADGIMSLSLNNELQTKTHGFKVSGIKVNDIVVPDLAFTVQSKNAKPVLSMSGKGTINPIDANSKMTWTIKLSYFSGTLDTSKLQIVEGPSGDIVDANTFYFTNCAGNTADLVMKPGADVKNKKYLMDVYYSIADDKQTDSIRINVTPKQTMPKLTLAANEATVFTGNLEKTTQITISPQTTGYTITDIEYNSKTSKEVQAAFADTKFEDDKIVVKLTDASNLVKNKTYTLYYNAIFKDQVDVTKGTEFSIKVTVK